MDYLFVDSNMYAEFSFLMYLITRCWLNKTGEKPFQACFKMPDCKTMYLRLQMVVKSL